MTKARAEWFCFACLEVFRSPSHCSMAWMTQNPPRCSPGALDEVWSPGPPIKAGTTLCSKNLESGRLWWLKEFKLVRQGLRGIWAAYVLSDFAISSWQRTTEVCRVSIELSSQTGAGAGGRQRVWEEAGLGMRERENGEVGSGILSTNLFVWVLLGGLLPVRTGPEQTCPHALWVQGHWLLALVHTTFSTLDDILKTLS